jgi:hypothetical protein
MLVCCSRCCSLLLLLLCLSQHLDQVEWVALDLPSNHGLPHLHLGRRGRGCGTRRLLHLRGCTAAAAAAAAAAMGEQMSTASIRAGRGRRHRTRHLLHLSSSEKTAAVAALIALQRLKCKFHLRWMGRRRTTRRLLHLSSIHMFQSLRT